MTEPAPFLEEAPVDPQAAQRRWALAGFLSLVVAGLAWLLVWAVPPLSEAFWGHAPAVATVTGRKTQVSYSREDGRRETDFHLITWVDDRGHTHRDLLEVGWRTYAPGTQVEIYYALAPDGSKRLILERRLHPAFILLALVVAAATVTFTVMWIRALRAVFRGTPAPGPIPDSDPIP